MEDIYDALKAGKYEHPRRPNKKVLDEFGNYEEHLQHYREECSRVHALFKTDLLEYCGLTRHPNADKIFNYAWEEWHSAGYYEIAQGLEELSDLFTDDRGRLLISPNLG